MEVKTTPLNFKTNILQNAFLTFLIVGWVVTGFSQTIIVGSVTPTTVTTQTHVTITGGTGFTVNTEVSCGAIYSTGPKTVSPDGTQLTFTITRNSVGASNDLGPTVLKIGNDEVYVDNTADPNNKVTLTYIAPTERKYSDTTNDFVVNEVYTTWDRHGNGDNFWRSTPFGEQGIPDDRHDLLAFTYRGVTYSTGVNDAKLDEKEVDYTSEVFKAYSTNGISGRPYNLTYLSMADKIDGVQDMAIYPNNSIMATAYDVLIDGENGLDLGTGITNFNQEANIRFYSGDGDELAINETPDLLLTQIADPGIESQDIYYYADIDGNVIGRPILLKMRNDDVNNNRPTLFDWKVNLYNLNRAPGVTFETSYPVSVADRWDANGTGTRRFRMMAFKLEDFEVNASNLGEVNNINLMAGGGADLAFIAYNAATFNIKSPTVDLPPISRYICDISDAKDIEFDVEASINGNPPIGVGQQLYYQWYREFAPISGATNNTYSLTPATVTDTIRFKVRVSNEFGAIDLPATLKEGGTPTYWDGVKWYFPKIFYDKDDELRFDIDDADRNLIFSADYNENTDLDGCDCVVPAGSTVTIPKGRWLKLRRNIIVQGEQPVFDETGVPGTPIPAGSFTLENNASLIQIKEEKKNEGEIVVNRNAKSGSIKKYDYIYWSSPVEEVGFSALSGQTSHVYEWDATAINANGTTGNWIAPQDTIMVPGRGYIKRVNDIINDFAGFEGTPNNGLISVEVKKSVTPLPSLNDDRHSNLIGNPYPSAIDADTFLDENTNLEGFVLLWTHDTGISSGEDNPFYENFKYNYGDQYITYNKLGPSEPVGFEGKIASGQGFFVKVLNTAPNSSEVEFTNAMRYGSGESVLGNSQFYKPEKGPSHVVATEKQLMWLSLVDERHMSATTLVGYAQGATNAKDRLYDAISGSGDMRIYSVLDDDDLIIQGRALPFDENDEVPLGIEILQNGIYKIGINRLEGSLMHHDDRDIYLVDTYTNTVHDLKKSPYGFTAERGNIKDRFAIKYVNQTLAVDDTPIINTFAYVKHQQLYIRAIRHIEAVEVYDLTGKLLMHHKLASYTDQFNTPFPLPKGAYLTVIKMENGGVVTKKIMH